MKISIETNVEGNAAATLDRLLTRIVALLEKGTGLKFDVKADGNTVRLAHKAKLLRKKANRIEAVAYDASETRYAAITLDHNGQIVNEEIKDGDENYSYEANLLTAETWAKRIAELSGLDPRYVYHDSAILEPERESSRRLHPTN
jgi:hypothetical protein